MFGRLLAGCNFNTFVYFFFKEICCTSLIALFSRANFGVIKRFVAILLFFCAIRVAAQTIAAPHLECVLNDFTGNNITLTWSNVPNACGPFVNYLIYGADPANGVYNVVGTVTNAAQTSFTINGALVLHSNWCFYMEANYNCAGAVIQQSDTICNEPNPQTPEIISASVQIDGHTLFSWKPSASPQTKAYIIYSFLPNGGVVPLDTVYGRFNTAWIDSIEDPNTQSLGYTVSAVDLCPGNQPSAYNQKPHQSLHLTERTSTCERNMHLEWTRYVNLPKGVLEYRIYASVNTAPYFLAGSVDSSKQTFDFINFNDGDSVILHVVAVSAADTTIQPSSNFIFLRANIVQPPKYLYITNLTVLSNNVIQTTWLVDSLAEIFLYQVENTPDCSHFATVKQYNPPSPLPIFSTYIDSSVVANETPYCYHIVAIDSCQGQKTSPPGKTILLTAELSDYYEVNLNWNAFELYGATVLNYYLYRDYGSGWQLIKVFDQNTGSFKDSLYNFLDQTGHFCYRIEARYAISLPDAGYTDTLLSSSNEVCIDHNPVIYIPNAFVPNGVNSVFKPKIIFGDPGNYTLQIFNRYGGNIFESNDPNVGWDGNDHGKPVQQGGYAYRIHFTTGDGVEIDRKGIVLLIRK
ncbi:MAG: gliding motility-associated C-terminal domain-containing protein [Chitinophagales bacterium]